MRMDGRHMTRLTNVVIIFTQVLIPNGNDESKSRQIHNGHF